MSTRRAPGRPFSWKPLDGGVVLTLPVLELMVPSCVRFAEIRASKEVDTSLGSLLVLPERSRP